MGKSSTANKKAQAAQKSKTILAAVGIITVLMLGFVFIKFNSGGAANSGNLKIPKSEVSEIAKFYAYNAGNTNMEVLAVKASDGTIRTAFNTCQVCYDSGRGYYKQQGNELVCQNCGNRFKLDRIEKLKGGCNPVPILIENKTEDDENIIISQAFMEENKVLFENWRK